MEETNESLQKRCGTRVIFENKSQILPILTKQNLDEFIIYNANRNDKIRDIIKCDPITDDHKRFIKQQFWGQSSLEEMLKFDPNLDPKLFDLKLKLLEFGGEEVCLFRYEEDLDDILTYGQLWIGNNIKMMRGEPSQCHSNSARLWLENKESCRICTGYALSSDGLWRQHSWVIWMKPKSNQIVETTTKRLAYFGFVMTTEQCELFTEEVM